MFVLVGARASHTRPDRLPDLQMNISGLSLGNVAALKLLNGFVMTPGALPADHSSGSLTSIP